MRGVPVALSIDVPVSHVDELARVRDPQAERDDLVVVVGVLGVDEPVAR